MYKIVMHYKEDLQKMSDFREQIQYIWADHVVYLRGLIASAASKTGDMDPLFKRLQTNSSDFMSIIGDYMPYDSNTYLTSLFDKNVNSIKDYLVKSVNKVDLSQSLTEWNTVISQLINAVSQFNPWHLPKTMIDSLLTTYQQQIMNLIGSQILSQWDASINATDLLHKTVADFGDVVAHGVIANSIDRFSTI